MESLLPIFPLNVVAFPGTTVPLHVFEERYRAMVRDLLEQPDPADRVFGIVAIREGYEVGRHGARSLYRTGCLMQVVQVEEYGDGRFHLAAVGRHRLRVLATETSRPYLRAEVEHLAGPEELTPQTAEAAARALAAFAAYRQAAARLHGEEVAPGRLPRDPELLSYALAAASGLPLGERQKLLESPTTAERLALLRRLLRQELRAMTAIPSLPASEVARTAWSPN